MLSSTAATVYAPSRGSALRGIEACRKAGRQSVNPVTCTRKEYDSATLEFMAAVDVYKRRHARPFPTLTEILGIVTDLGYEKARAHEEVRAPRSGMIVI